MKLLTWYIGRMPIHSLADFSNLLHTCALKRKKRVTVIDIYNFYHFSDYNMDYPKYFKDEKSRHPQR